MKTKYDCESESEGSHENLLLNYHRLTFCCCGGGGRVKAQPKEVKRPPCPMVQSDTKIDNPRKICNQTTYATSMPRRMRIQRNLLCAVDAVAELLRPAMLELTQKS